MTSHIETYTFMCAMCSCSEGLGSREEGTSLYVVIAVMIMIRIIRTVIRVIVIILLLASKSLYILHPSPTRRQHLRSRDLGASKI